MAPLGPDQARIAPLHCSAVLPCFLGSPSHIPPLCFEEMEAENFCSGTNQGTKSQGALQGLTPQAQEGAMQWVHCPPLSVTNMLDWLTKINISQENSHLAESARQCMRWGFDSWVGKDPLVKEVTTNSSSLAWEIPWTEEPGRLQSMECRVGHDGAHGSLHAPEALATGLGTLGDSHLKNISQQLRRLWFWVDIGLSPDSTTQ